MATFTVAAVQATYVLMDREATIDRAEELTADAAAQGAQLVVFPEVFVPGNADLDCHATHLGRRP